jgi:hypothetical protein
VYAALLRVYPLAYRTLYAEDMVQLFGDQLREARARDRRSAVLVLWVRSLIDLAVTAPGERMRREEPVPQPVEPAGWRQPGPQPHPTLMRVGYVLCASPLILMAVLLLLARGFLDPLFDNPPGIAGLPAGLVGLFVVAVWASIGLAVAWFTRSVAGVLIGFVLFALPALTAILFLPAVILIIQNLGT